MTHEDALKELAVERYLLGELSGEVRERFEEHLFDCLQCARDVKDGVLFVEAAGTELTHVQERVPQTKVSRGWFWLWQGWVLGPALAACLAVLLYQSAVVLPAMRTQLAESQMPTVLAPLVLANAGARGDAVAEVVSPRQGVYLLSVDIPTAPKASAYRCTLYSPAGKQVWHVDVAPERARDSVMIEVPATSAQEGMNELLVQALTVSQDGGDKLTNVAHYRYKVTFAK